MLSFTRAANLRGLIRDRLLPESASRLYKFLEPWLGTSYNGTLEKETEAVGSRDMLVFPGRVLDDPAYQSWLYDGVKRKNNLKVVNRIRQLLAWEPNETQHCTHLFHRGATYAPVPDLGTAATCPEAGDSTIEYRTKEGTLVAGRIVHILHRGMLKAEAKASSNTKVVVQRYKALEQKDVSKDKFRLWSGFRAHLVLPQFSERLEVIDASDIIAHVATCPFRDPSGNIEGQFVVIWPLDRVGEAALLRHNYSDSDFSPEYVVGERMTRTRRRREDFDPSETPFNFAPDFSTCACTFGRIRSYRSDCSSREQVLHVVS